MSPRYVAVRGSATADSVCVMHPALEASTDLTASVTITPVSASVGSSVEVSNTHECSRLLTCFCVEPFALEILCLQATGCVTAGSVTVRAAGQGSIVTAAPALRRACQRMALSAADGGDVSVVTVSALYLEHLGTGVRSAQRVETPVAPQGENEFKPSALRGETGCDVEPFVSFTSVIAVSSTKRYKMLSLCAT